MSWFSSQRNAVSVFPGAGGRENERVRPARDRGPAFALWRAWRAERVAKPRSDDRMEGL